MTVITTIVTVTNSLIVNGHDWLIKFHCIDTCYGTSTTGDKYSVLGVNRADYTHHHVGVYISVWVRPELFKAIVQAHVNNCELAHWEALNAITVRLDYEPNREEPTGLIECLGVNVSGLDTRGGSLSGILNEEEYRIGGAAVLEAVHRDTITLVV